MWLWQVYFFEGAVVPLDLSGSRPRRQIRMDVVLAGPATM